MIRIRAFKAPNDIETCLKFIEGHRRLLEIHFGVAKITSSNNEWIHNPNVVVVIAEDETGERIFGGARVQVHDGVNSLPIETAVGHYDPKIFDAIQPGCCELGALWNSMEVQGMGIGAIFLVRVCVVLTAQLPVDKMYLLCAPVTVRMGKRIGALIDESLGNHGTFYYPKDDFIATAMVLNDLDELSHAEANERAIIFSLRENLDQIRTENSPKSELTIHYNLKL